MTVKEALVLYVNINTRHFSVMCLAHALVAKKKERVGGYFYNLQL